MPGKLSDLLWGPLFARGYDRLTKSTEEAGLSDKRRALLTRAQGRTLDRRRTGVTSNSIRTP